MATFPLNWVGKSPSAEKLSLGFRQAAMQSPFTLTQQTVNTASQWRLQFTWPRMSFAEAEVCSAWLDSLRGQVGTFRYYPRQAYGSSLTGKGLASAAYNYNNSISVEGWAANASAGLRLGQFFQLGTQLLRITSGPAAANAQGRCVIEFEPQLRINYATGTALNFSNPCGIFRLATSDGYGFALDPDRNPTFETISAAEAVD